MKTTMRKLFAFGLGVGSAFALAAVIFSPHGCSHQKASADGQDSLSGPRFARLLPQPAFAYAGETGRKEVSLADVTERSLPSVVNISMTKVAKLTGSQALPFFNDPFFRRFFGDRGPGPQMPPEQKEQGQGSGVIVSADGLILTNNHVVSNAEEITVTLADHRELKAKVVGADPKSDLAVIRLEGHPKDLKPLPFGDSNRLRLGDVVLAIGNPFGVGQTVTMGIVSAKGRANMGIVDYEDFIQTDAAINPGNSGGALINMAGELVGINTAILSRTGGYQGIGFAIPANMARPIMESLLKHGKVVRGWLGVAIQDLSPEMAKAFGLKVNSGVLISDVTEGSPAAKAGLKRGDVVVRLNGEKVESTGALRNLVAAAGAKASAKLEVLREGKSQIVTVQLGELPAELGGGSPTAPGQDKEVLSGLTVETLNGQLRQQYNIPSHVTTGVVVTDVARGSQASQTGIRPGDVVLEVNRSPVKRAEQFARLYQAAKKQALLLVLRQGHTMYLLITK